MTPGFGVGPWGGTDRAEISRRELLIVVGAGPILAPAASVPTYDASFTGSALLFVAHQHDQSCVVLGWLACLRRHAHEGGERSCVTVHAAARGRLSSAATWWWPSCPHS